MQSYLIWVIAGFALIIAELVTGTFYLLVLGVAALAGGGAAYSGASFWIQVIVAAGVAVVGFVWVHQHRKAANTKPMASLELGQAVTLDSWVNEAEGLARVKYRNTLWDARVAPGSGAAPGATLYIAAVDGSTLQISKNKPA